MARLDEANEPPASRAGRGGKVDEREVWRLFARPELFAVMGCKRSNSILDGIAFAVGIIKHFGITSPVGRHVGATTGGLAQLVQKEVVSGRRTCHSLGVACRGTQTVL